MRSRLRTRPQPAPRCLRFATQCRRLTDCSSASRLHPLRLWPPRTRASRPAPPAHRTHCLRCCRRLRPVRRSSPFRKPQGQIRHRSVRRQLLWPSDRVLHPSAPLRLRQRSPPPGGRPTCWCCCRLNRHRHRPRQRPLRPQLPPAPRPQRRLRFSCRARRRAGCPRATCSGLIAAHRSLPAARLVTCWSTCPTSPARPEAGS